MSGARIRTALAVILAASAAASFVLADAFEESRVSASFLKIGTGARASAMGEAFTAVADDANALLWNPAGLAMVRKVELQVTHNQWLYGMQIEHFCLAIPAGGTWGVSYSLANLGSFAEWQGPGTAEGGTFSVNDQVFTAGYGNIFFADSVSLGATARVITENLGGGVGGQTMSMDIGAMAQPWWVAPGLTVAGVIQNVGGELSGFELPFGARLGIAWRREGLWVPAGSPAPERDEDRRAKRATYPWENQDMQGDMVTLSAESLILKTGRAEFHIGCEYWMTFVALRAGYRYRFPRNDLGGSTGLTLGLGLRGHSFQFDYGFDYAYAPYGALGDASRFSVLVAF